MMPMMMMWLVDDVGVDTEYGDYGVGTGMVCDSGHAFAEMKRMPVAAATASRGLEPWPSDGTALTIDTRQGQINFPQP